MLDKSKDYLNRLKMLKGRTESKRDQDYVQLHIDIMEYLVDCAEEVDENSKKTGELNEFLQKRDAGKHLGKHVIDAVMGYVQEIEIENKRYGEALETIKYLTRYDDGSKAKEYEIASRVLEELK